MADATLGRFVWHELLTTDVKAAAGFYGKVLGWKTQPYGNDGAYTLFAKAGRPCAGLMLLPDEAKAMGAPPNWLMYVGTPNVDDTAKKATSLGATVVKEPTDIPGAGRFAVVQDPQGAVFGIYQDNPAAASTSSSGPDGMGDFSWHELSTTDWKAGFEFYQKLFGWQATSAMDMGPEMGMYQMYGLDGKSLGGMMNKPKTQPGPPAWLPYILVPDSKKIMPLTTKSGGTVIHGPMEVPGGDFIAIGMDPQGAVFAVHSVTKPAAAPAAPPAKAAAKSAAKPTPKPAAKAAAKPAAKPAASKAAPKAAAKKAAPKKTKPARKPVAKKAVKKAVRKAVKKAVKKTAKAAAKKASAKKGSKKGSKKR